MKNFIILLFLPLILSGQQPYNQQEGLLLLREPGSTAVGVRTGVSYSKSLLKNHDLFTDLFYDFPYLGRMNEEEILPVQSFSFGIFIHQQLSSRWFLSADALYKTSGFRVELDMPQTKNDDYGDFFFNYISLPLLFNLKVGEHVSAYAGVGGYVSYLLNVYIVKPYYTYDHDLDAGWPYTPEVTYIGDFRVDETEGFEKLDLGLSAQAGVIIPIEDCLEIDLQIVCSHSLMSALRPEKHIFRKTRYFHRTLLITLGFRWML